MNLYGESAAKNDDTVLVFNFMTVTVARRER